MQHLSLYSSGNSVPLQVPQQVVALVPAEQQDVPSEFSYPQATSPVSEQNCAIPSVRKQRQVVMSTTDRRQGS